MILKALGIKTEDNTHTFAEAMFATLNFSFHWDSFSFILFWMTCFEINANSLVFFDHLSEKSCHKN